MLRWAMNWLGRPLEGRVSLRGARVVGLHSSPYADTRFVELQHPQSEGTFLAKLLSYEAARLQKGDTLNIYNAAVMPHEGGVGLDATYNGSAVEARRRVAVTPKERLWPPRGAKVGEVGEVEVAIPLSDKVKIRAANLDGGKRLALAYSYEGSPNYFRNIVSIFTGVEGDVHASFTSTLSQYMPDSYLEEVQASSPPYEVVVASYGNPERLRDMAKTNVWGALSDLYDQEVRFIGDPRRAALALQWDLSDLASNPYRAGGAAREIVELLPAIHGDAVLRTPSPSFTSYFIGLLQAYTYIEDYAKAAAAATALVNPVADEQWLTHFNFKTQEEADQKPVKLLREGEPLIGEPDPLDNAITQYSFDNQDHWSSLPARSKAYACQAKGYIHTLTSVGVFTEDDLNALEREYKAKFDRYMEETVIQDADNVGGRWVNPLLEPIYAIMDEKLLQAVRGYESGREL